MGSVAAAQGRDGRTRRFSRAILAPTMSEPTASSERSAERRTGLAGLAVRGACGGVLMGLANLVPGISGGTMLLAVGIYPRVIEGIAELTTLRFRAPTLAVIGSVLAAAVVAIAAGAGLLKDLVVGHRWVMYSLFIGLTLGGAPILLRLLRPMPGRAWIAVAAGVGVMVCTVLLRPEGSGAGSHNYAVLFTAGVLGAAAMILPGVSGGYLLLVLGQYVTILAAIDQFKRGLLGGDGAPGDLSLALHSLHVIIPVGLGVVVGIAGVSHLLKFFLRRFEKATLGLLLGLLLGAVVGLWPFQRGIEPQVGQTIKGQVVTEENRLTFDDDDWPVEFFTPAPAQVAGSLGLVAAGFVITLGVARLGRE